MKRSLIGLLLGFTIAAILWKSFGDFWMDRVGFHEPPDPPQSNSVRPTAPVWISLPLKEGLKKKPLKVSRGRRSDSKIPPKPEGNRVEFQVVDGLAVAYGDLILGKLEEGVELTRGFYEAPNPQLWDKPEIPYAINSDLSNPERVEKAIEYFRQRTPVRFIPLTTQKDAIIFQAGSEHCFSALGKIGGYQPIKLSSECQVTEIIHEIMHALGFIHEQSRPDRDQFVEILWENIEDPYQSQFAMVPDSFLETIQGAPFDYHSVMLYRPDSFARSRDLVTLRSRGKDRIEPATGGLSEGDMKRLNRLYDLYQ